MAGPIAKLYATLGLDAREFTKGVDTAQSKTKSLTSSFKSQAMTGLGLGAGFGVAQLGFKAVGAAIDFVGDSVRAAIEETKGIATLTQAIEANDAAWDGNVDAIEEVIRARTDLAFADDEQRASLQRLVSVTGDVQKALELQRTAMDLARLRGMDLATAGDLIGKVYAGNLGTLSRYGIVLEKGTTATEALAEIQRRAAGSAEAYAETAGGQMEVAQLAMNDAMEDFGAALLPVVTELMPHFIDLIKLAADGAQVFSDVLSGTDPGAIAPLIEDMKALREAEAAAALGQQALTGEWAASGTPLDSMLDGFNDLMAGLESVSPARQEFLKWDAALRDAADRLGLTTDQLTMFRFEAEAAGLTVEEAAARLEAFADKSLMDAFDPLAGATIEPPDLVTPIRESFKLATAEVAKGFGSIKDALENPPQMIAKGQRLENMQGRLREIIRNIRKAVETGDPWALNYWEAARAKQQAAYDRLKGRTTADLSDVRQTYKQAGVAVEGTWTDTTFAVSAASRKSADAAIAEMQRAKDTISKMSMVQTGTDLMTSLGIGFENAAPSLYAAADRIAAEVRRRLNAPPPPPPTVPAATSSGVVINGNVYGGKAGTRQLAGDIERATRPTNRYRRHNNLAEG
jgi:hypothetical protein